MAELLDEYKAQGFEGPISVEYEYNWENSLPEVKQCIDFVRKRDRRPTVPLEDTVKPDVNVSVEIAPSNQPP